MFSGKEILILEIYSKSWILNAALINFPFELDDVISLGINLFGEDLAIYINKYTVLKSIFYSSW